MPPCQPPAMCLSDKVFPSLPFPHHLEDRPSGILPGLWPVAANCPVFSGLLARSLPVHPPCIPVAVRGVTQSILQSSAQLLLHAHHCWPSLGCWLQRPHLVHFPPLLVPIHTKVLPDPLLHTKERTGKHHLLILEDYYALSFILKK